jgi:tetratricopeptide repeat protein 12
LDANKKEPSLDKVDIENFLVRTKYDQTIINKSNSQSSDQGIQDAKCFMANVEKDANRRAADRKQREVVAQELRKWVKWSHKAKKLNCIFLLRLGNQAFRNGEFEKAVTMYTKALDQVRDSPILYNNRALSFISLTLYKRAIIDCDFVLNKLDEKNLRAWLYRGKAYFLLHEKRLYEKSIFEAKKHHPKDLSFIEKIVKEIEGVSKSEEDENCEEETSS